MKTSERKPSPEPKIKVPIAAPIEIPTMVIGKIKRFALRNGERLIINTNGIDITVKMPPMYSIHELTISVGDGKYDGQDPIKNKMKPGITIASVKVISDIFLLKYYFIASIPLVISDTSRVIAAWRTLLNLLKKRIIQAILLLLSLPEYGTIHHNGAFESRQLSIRGEYLLLLW